MHEQILCLQGISPCSTSMLKHVSIVSLHCLDCAYNIMQISPSPEHYPFLDSLHKLRLKHFLKLKSNNNGQ